MTTKNASNNEVGHCKKQQSCYKVFEQFPFTASKPELDI